MVVGILLPQLIFTANRPQAPTVCQAPGQVSQTSPCQQGVPGASTATADCSDLCYRWKIGGEHTDYGNRERAKGVGWSEQSSQRWGPFCWASEDESKFAAREEEWWVFQAGNCPKSVGLTASSRKGLECRVQDRGLDPITSGCKRGFFLFLALKADMQQAQFSAFKTCFENGLEAGK